MSLKVASRGKTKESREWIPVEHH